MKDVIYIEPEDDITDIITKIENSKEKIVALVPPKKAGVFRSVVNIKLIAKASAAAEKTVVMVTVDPSIIKLAAATKLPVTKNLQTPPKIPTAEDEIMEAAKEEIIDGPEDEEEEEAEAKEAGEDTDSNDKKFDKEDSKDIEDKEDLVASTVKEIEAKDEENEEDEEEEKEEKPDRSKKKNKKAPAKTGNKVLDWIKSHKKLSIAAGVGFGVLVIFLIWAFAIAPAATVTIGIQTSSTNFSENVNFTTDSASENIKEGKFYIEERKVESKQELKFEATGQKNNGEKATGEVVIYKYFEEDGTIPISAGSSFTISGLSYVSDAATSLSWDGEQDSCENEKIVTKDQAGHMVVRCLISGRVAVTASEPGTIYNISPSNSGWSTVAPVQVYSDKAMSGGTDQMVTVVQQSDVIKAKEELSTANESENKAKLLEAIPDEYMVIDSSFSQTTDDIATSPAVGEEIKEGVKPTLTATSRATMFVVEKSKITEFIEEKAKIGDDQKIYEMKDPFIENFVGSGSEYTGRLKTSYAAGPKITENDVVEMIKGKGIGDAQHDLKTIDGVVDVKITTSFPWVSGIPGDTNKITVNMEVKDQGQNNDKNQDKDQDKDKEKDKKE